MAPGSLRRGAKHNIEGLMPQLSASYPINQSSHKFFVVAINARYGQTTATFFFTDV